ncbi:copper amine oxidase N-terminal domain-containing protein [Desulfolucanica intricata]|uniref:copper amine oxidase N-terminal domain-containing protein n=1 Tax=Desulfolucanica intricata TaxID=1285191 RepID=UPI00083233DF|nr:copper amine oxidase N-terminal domain-containing protein [Desulfolucanica intricata]
MKKKNLLIVAIALLFCFSIVFATGAAQPAAKDLVLAKIKDFKFEVDKGFYEKSLDESHFTITKFDGSVKNNLGDYAGTKIDLLSYMDIPNNTIKIDYVTNIKGQAHKGEVYLAGDKIILTKDILNLLKELGLDVFKDNPVLEQSPQYLYIADAQLKSIWEQIAGYQNQQLPEEYKELLLFLVEAIPDKYFSISPGKVTLKLDQEGLVDVAANLLEKVKNEPERVADILVGLNKYNTSLAGAPSPEEMKNQIISGIKSTTFPTREELQIISNFVEIKDFIYEASLLPGGAKKFNMDINIKTPGNTAGGQFLVTVNSKGNQDNLEGSFIIKGNYTDPKGPEFALDISSKYNYRGPIANAGTNVFVKAKDNATGELLLDLGVIGNSVTKVDNSLVLNAPELTADNSLDITTLIRNAGAANGELNLIVNDNNIDTPAKPSVKEGQMMLPLRAVAEALGYEVQWIDPNEVRITGGDNLIILLINEKSYQVNGVEKTIDIPAYLNEGFTMAPISFISTELGAKVEFASGAVIIKK